MEVPGDADGGEGRDFMELFGEGGEETEAADGEAEDVVCDLLLGSVPI